MWPAARLGRAAHFDSSEFNKYSLKKKTSKLWVILTGASGYWLRIPKLKNFKLKIIFFIFIFEEFVTWENHIKHNLFEQSGDLAIVEVGSLASKKTTQISMLYITICISLNSAPGHRLIFCINYCLNWKYLPPCFITVNFQFLTIFI
jgi:hypothetical protein